MCGPEKPQNCVQFDCAARENPSSQPLRPGVRRCCQCGGRGIARTSFCRPTFGPPPGVTPGRGTGPQRGPVAGRSAASRAHSEPGLWELAGRDHSSGPTARPAPATGLPGREPVRLRRGRPYGGEWEPGCVAAVVRRTRRPLVRTGVLRAGRRRLRPGEPCYGPGRNPATTSTASGMGLQAVQVASVG